MTISKRHSVKKGDSYGVSVYNPLTQKMKWIGTYPDELSARQAELDAERLVNSGLAPAGDENPKIADVVEKWLLYAKRDSTREDYARGARFILEFFGQRRVRTLGPEDFFRFTIFMRKQRKKDGNPYSPRVVRKVVVQLYQLVNFATEFRYIDRSPAPRMKRLPLPPEPAARKVSLTSEQVRRLLDAVPDAWRDFFTFALVTGARRGELFNATYGAIQWESMTMQVRDRHPDGSPGAVKSKAGVRTIPLTSGVVQLLERRMTEADATDDDLIFPNSIGGKMSYPNFYRRIWAPVVEAAGLKGLHLHDLRKAFASHLAAGGRSPSYIEAVMGHASYATTMKYYTQTSESEATKARNQLEDWLGHEETGDYSQVA